MHRAQPVASALCDEKWRERAYRIHRQKLQKTKPTVDTKTPPVYPHLHQKLKKAQMEEERCTEIERDNRTLVRRMTQIMQRSSLDSRNTVQYKSLNRDRRRRELIRITQENQALLKRIQSRQPTYNHLIWEQEREKNEVLCERICRYPYRPAGFDEAPEDSEQGMYEYYAKQGGTPSSNTADKTRFPKITSPTGSAHDSASPGAVADREGSKSRGSAMSASQLTASSFPSPTKSAKDEDDADSSASGRSHHDDDLDASKSTSPKGQEADDEGSEGADAGEAGSGDEGEGEEGHSKGDESEEQDDDDA